MANGTTVINVGGESQTPPVSPNSENGSQPPEQQERAEALQLGAVLESHRTTLENQSQIQARLESLESSQRSDREQFGQSLARIEAMLAEEEEMEVEGEVEEVIPETPPAAPEPEPKKARSGWHRVMFG